MNRHPGGEEHTRHMLALAALPEGARILDLGAGAGESVELLRALGYDAAGIDLEPRSDSVQKGDLLHTGYPDASFDGVLSQCAFFLSGDVPGAFREEALSFLRSRIGARLYDRIMAHEENRRHPYVTAKVFLSAAEWKQYIWIEQHGSLTGFAEQRNHSGKGVSI